MQSHPRYIYIMTFFMPVLTTVGGEHHQSDHKPGKPGVLGDFYEHGKLWEFCATSGEKQTK